jgi:putative transposase
VTDTEGNILVARVHSAGIQDRDGARDVLAAMKEKYPTVKHGWADGGYAGALVAWSAEADLNLEIVRKIVQKGFQLVKRRWVVERTFGWFGFFRRLSKDYEELPKISENVIYSAMTLRMLSRLTQT